MLGLLQAEEFLQAAVNAAESGEPKEALPWVVLTQEAQNSIILRAKRADICDGANPKTDIVEILNSNEVPAFDPIKDYSCGFQASMLGCEGKLRLKGKE